MGSSAAALHSRKSSALPNILLSFHLSLNFMAVGVYQFLFDPFPAWSTETSVHRSTNFQELHANYFTLKSKTKLLSASIGVSLFFGVMRTSTHHQGESPNQPVAAKTTPLDITNPIATLIQDWIDRIRTLPSPCEMFNGSSQLGFCVRYIAIHRSVEGLSIALQERAEKSATTAIVSSAARACGATDPEDPGAQRAVFSYLCSRLFKDGFVFHGFNGRFFESITTHGLSGSMRAWKYETAVRLAELSEKSGVFTTALLRINSLDQIHVSADPEVAYGYALGSPEWFAFLSGRDDLSIDARTLSDRAHRLVTEPRCQLSPLEQTEFLELYGEVLDAVICPGVRPGLALVPRAHFPSMCHTAEELEQYIEEFHNSSKSLSPRLGTAAPSESGFWKARYLLHPHLHLESTLKGRIGPEQLHLVRLPLKDEVIPPSDW